MGRRGGGIPLRSRRDAAARVGSGSPSWSVGGAPRRRLRSPSGGSSASSPTGVSVASLAVASTISGSAIGSARRRNLRTLKEALSNLGPLVVLRCAPDASTLVGAPARGLSRSRGARCSASSAERRRGRARSCCSWRGSRSDRRPGRDSTAASARSRGRHRLPSRADVPRERLPDGAILGIVRRLRSASLRRRSSPSPRSRRFLDTPVHLYSHGMYDAPPRSRWPPRRARRARHERSSAVGEPPSTTGVWGAGEAPRDGRRCRARSPREPHMNADRHADASLPAGRRVPRRARRRHAAWCPLRRDPGAVDHEAGSCTRGLTATDQARAHFVHFRATGGTDGLLAGGPREVTVRLRATRRSAAIAVGVAGGASRTAPALSARRAATASPATSCRAREASRPRCGSPSRTSGPGSTSSTSTPSRRLPAGRFRAVRAPLEVPSRRRPRDGVRGGSAGPLLAGEWQAAHRVRILFLTYSYLPHVPAASAERPEPRRRSHRARHDVVVATHGFWAIPRRLAAPRRAPGRPPPVRVVWSNQTRMRRPVDASARHDNRLNLSTLLALCRRRGVRRACASSEPRHNLRRPARGRVSGSECPHAIAAAISGIGFPRRAA